MNLGARVNAHCSDDGRTPLHLAAATGNLSIVKLLLSAQTDINAVDGNGRTPLHSAVHWKAKSVIIELLKQGADPQIADTDLLTPICYGVRMADVELLRFMIQNGMDINEGSIVELPTPLHIAVQNGSWKMARFLLESGADPFAKDIDGSIPLLLAARLGHRSLVDVLLNTEYSLGDQLNETDYTGNTVLHYAASNGWSEIVEKLIQLGVDVNRPDPRGFTALYYADLNRHVKIVARLTREGGLARWLTTSKLRRCSRIHQSCRW